MSEQCSSASRLLVDIGNTRTKYVYCDDNGVLSKTHYLYKEEKLEALLSTVNEVVVACVNKEGALTAWHEAAESKNLAFTHVQTQPEAFGVQCPYDKPHKLGIDRWLCALAVAKRTHHAVAIIDVGTAATCDFVVGSEYIGGWIAPGFDLMRRALVSNTAKVLANNHFPTEIQIGKDTEDCVNGGCLAMISGFITEAKNQLDAIAEQNSIILTGGSAPMLAKVSTVDCVIEEDLLFKGLRLFSSVTAQNIL